MADDKEKTPGSEGNVSFFVGDGVVELSPCHTNGFIGLLDNISREIPKGRIKYDVKFIRKDDTSIDGHSEGQREYIDSNELREYIAKNAERDGHYVSVYVNLVHTQRL